MNPSILLALTLVCHDPKIVNTSGYTWTPHDSSVLDHAKVRCGEIWEDAPCLKVFYKKGQKNYAVVCGAKEK
jgi:hypothetical protein